TVGDGGEAAAEAGGVDGGGQLVEVDLDRRLGRGVGGGADREGGVDDGADREGLVVGVVGDVLALDVVGQRLLDERLGGVGEVGEACGQVGHATFSFRAPRRRARRRSIG